MLEVLTPLQGMYLAVVGVVAMAIGITSERKGQTTKTFACMAVFGIGAFGFMNVVGQALGIHL